MLQSAEITMRPFSIRFFLTIVGPTLLLFSIFGSLESFAFQDQSKLSRVTANTRPNVVFIVSDDQAWTDYGFMGHPIIQTPRLDELASRSAFFPRGYVPTALCRPSLATIVSGLYAHQHRIIGNDPSVAEIDPQSASYSQRRESMIASFDSVPTLPKLLSEQGYKSHQSGKWWEGSFRRGGFTHGMTRGFPDAGGRHGDDGLVIGRQGMQPIADFLNANAQSGDPFLLWYAPFLPHSPHDPPARLLEKYRDKAKSLHVAKYFAMCEWFDETCGQLIDLLRATGQMENTLIVYVGDNGWIQDPDTPNFAPRSKQSPYEGGVRQPILISWPDRIVPGKREDLISSIDLLPTVLDAAGVQPPISLPGYNLMPHLRNNTKIARDRIYGEGFDHDVISQEQVDETLLYRWVIEGRWKLILTYDGRVGRYASTHPRTELRPQLFDLEEDPHELQNVAGLHPELVTKLALGIRQWWPVHRRKVIEQWTD